MRIKLPSGLTIRTSPFYPWERGRVDLRIRCRSAFHPRHVTSKLSLELMDASLRGAAHGSFLDVGCGSGILALAALRLGARRAVGVDIDPRAIHASRDNALSNGLKHRAEWILGSSSAVRGAFDFVAANLPFPILHGILVELMDLVKVGGHLLISGFHDIEEDPIQGLLAARRFTVVRSIRGDLSFPELPPARSHTWVATLARKTGARADFSAFSP